MKIDKIKISLTYLLFYQTRGRKDEIHKLIVLILCELGCYLSRPLGAWRLVYVYLNTGLCPVLLYFAPLGLDE